MMDNIDKGILLEELYKRKMIEKLMSGGMNQSDAIQVADKMTGYENPDIGRAYLNKPMYESLDKIPMIDQLKMMKEHNSELKGSLPNKKKEDYLQQLNVGERYV